MFIPFISYCCFRSCSASFPPPSPPSTTIAAAAAAAAVSSYSNYSYLVRACTFGSGLRVCWIVRWMRRMRMSVYGELCMSVSVPGSV